MRALQALQPQIKEIQEKYKDDRQRMQREMMALYQENKVNPLSSCLPLLLQIPVFIALYQLLREQQLQGRGRSLGGAGWLFVTDLIENPTGAEAVVLIVLFGGSHLGAALLQSLADRPAVHRSAT